MIKAIIFDMGGVITHPGTTTGMLEIYSKAFKKPMKNFESATRRNSPLAQQAKMTFDDFINKIAKSAKVDVKKLRKVSLDANKVKKSKYGILKKLRKKYKIYALTNHMKTWFEYEEKKYKLGRYFDKIFTSYDIKANKPGPKIYKFVLKKIKLKPKECIFIDNQKSNVGGARNVGLNAILFKSSNDLKKELKRYGVEI